MSFRRQEEKEALLNRSGATKVSAINLPSSDSDDDVILMEDSSPDEAFPDISVKTPVNKEKAKQSASSLRASQACKSHKGPDRGASSGITENGLLVPPTERKAHADKGSSPALGKKTLASGHSSVPSRPETKVTSQPRPAPRIKSPPALSPSQRGPSLWDGRIPRASSETKVSKTFPAHVRNRADANSSVIRSKSPHRHKVHNNMANNNRPSSSLPSTHTKSQQPHAVKPTQSHSSSSLQSGNPHHTSHKHPRAKQLLGSSSSEKERVSAHDVSKRKQTTYHILSQTTQRDVAGGVRADRTREGEKTNLNRSHKKVGKHSTAGSGGTQPVKGKEPQGGMGKSISPVGGRVEGKVNVQTPSQATSKVPSKGTPLSLSESLPGASNRGGINSRGYHVPEPPSVLPDDLRCEGSSDHHLDTPRSQVHSQGTGDRSTKLVTSKPARDPPSQPCAADLKQKKAKVSSGRDGSSLKDAPAHSAGSKPAGKKSKVAKCTEQLVERPQKSKPPTTTSAAAPAITNTTTSATAIDSVTVTAITKSSVSMDTAGTVVSANPVASYSTETLVKEKDNDTESSQFDFGEDDYFEVLDSVETDSLCSAYNQSDMESTTVGSDDPSSRLPSEADQVLPVAPSNLTKSFSQQQPPSGSCALDMSASFPRKRRQFARKSTGSRFKYYKHPTRGLMRLRRHCRLELKRDTVVKVMKDIGGKAQLQEHTAKKGMVKAKYLSHGKHGISASSNKDSLGQSSREGQQIKKRKHLSPDSIEVSAKKPKHMLANPSKKPAQAFTMEAAVGMKQRKEPQWKPSTSSNGGIATSAASHSTHPLPSGHQTLAKNSSLPSQASSPASQLSAKHNRHIFHELLDSETDSTLTTLSDSEQEQETPSSFANCGEHQVRGDCIAPAVRPSNTDTGDGCARQLIELGEADHPAERQVTSEPTTPVGKRCLSLKHNKISQTISSGPSPDTPADTPTTAPVKNVSTSSSTGTVDQHDRRSATVDQHDRRSATVVYVASHPPPRRLSGKVICTILGSSFQPQDQTSVDEEGSGRLSRRDEAYDMRLQETIAKLTPEDVAVDNVFQRRLPLKGVEGTPMEEEEEERDKDITCTPLLVRVPLGCLRRRPSLSLGPMVSTRPLGMFTDKGVQAERGMIVDKEVLDAYLVVKLHEAMFDMKEQLQRLEAQVVNIGKQKESLERTLQSKIKYIRDMTSTGFKPGVVDVATETDPSLSGSPSPPRSRDITTAATQTRKSPGSSKAYRSVETVDVGTQTGKRPATHITVSCQTEGVVRYVPARLQDVQQPPCLYNHPDREIQLYIERGREISPPPYSHAYDNYGEVPPPNEQWLSTSVWESCSRCVPICQKVRFLRAMQEKARERAGCARCLPVERPIRSSDKAPARKKVTVPKVQFSQPEGASGASTSREGPHTSEGLPPEGRRDKGKEEEGGCIPASLQAPISNLIQLYFKLESIPETPVLARHMSALLRAVHHLLSHLPVSLEPRKNCSSPATPGAAAWSIGAKLQELMESLRELKEQGEELLPAYFIAELARLQQMVQDTLSFATSGIQNETFTYNQFGCIVDSDLHLRPWRNQDLHENPYFRRLCLDVGIRGIVQQMRQLQDKSARGSQPAEHDSESDSDIDSLISSHTSSPPPAQPRKKASRPTKRARKKNGRKTKFTVKRLRPTQRKPKRIVHLSIPAPEEQARASGLDSTHSQSRWRRSSSSSIAMDTDISSASSLTSLRTSRRSRMPSKTSEIAKTSSPAPLSVSSSPPATCSSTAVRLSASSKPSETATNSSPTMAVSSLPSLTTPRRSGASSTPSEAATSTSPSSVSPRVTSMSVCNSLIASGKNIQMRVMDVQSQVSTTLAVSAVTPAPSVQPKTAPQPPSVAPSRPSLSQVVANRDAFGGNPILTQFLVNQINDLLGKSRSGSAYTVSDAIKAIASQEQLKSTASGPVGHSLRTTQVSAHQSGMMQVSVAQIQREANSTGFTNLSGARTSRLSQASSATSLLPGQPVNMELIESLLNRVAQQATAKRANAAAPSSFLPTAGVIAHPLTTFPSSAIPRIPNVLPLPPLATGPRTTSTPVSSLAPSPGAGGLAPSQLPVGVFPLSHLRLPATLPQGSPSANPVLFPLARASLPHVFPPHSLPTPLNPAASLSGSAIRSVSSLQPLSSAPSHVTSHPYPVVMATSVPITTFPQALPPSCEANEQENKGTQAATRATPLTTAATPPAPVVGETPKEGGNVHPVTPVPPPPPSSSVSSKDSAAAVAPRTSSAQSSTPDPQARSVGECDGDTTAPSSSHRVGDALTQQSAASGSSRGTMMVRAAVHPTVTTVHSTATTQSSSGSKGLAAVATGTGCLAKPSATASTTVASMYVQTFATSLPLILSSSRSKVVKASIMGGRSPPAPSTRPSVSPTSQPVPSTNGSSQPVLSTNGSSQPVLSTNGSSQPVPTSTGSNSSTMGGNSIQPVPSTSEPIPSTIQPVLSTNGSSQSVPTTSGSGLSSQSATTNSHSVPSSNSGGHPVPSVRGGSHSIPSVKGGNQPVPSTVGGNRVAPPTKGSVPPISSPKGESRSIPSTKGGQPVPSASALAKGGQPIPSVKASSQLIPSTNGPILSTTRDSQPDPSTARGSQPTPSVTGGSQPVSPTTVGSGITQPPTGGSGDSHHLPSSPQPLEPADHSTDSLSSTPSLPVSGASKDSASKLPSGVSGSRGDNEGGRRTATSEEAPPQHDSSRKSHRQDLCISPPPSCSTRSPISSPILTSHGIIGPHRITKEENTVSVPPKTADKQSNVKQPLPLSSTSSMTQSSSEESLCPSSAHMSSCSAVTKTSSLVTTATSAQPTTALHTPLLSSTTTPTFTTHLPHAPAYNPTPQANISTTASLATPTHPHQVHSSASQQLQTVSHPLPSTATRRPTILSSRPTILPSRPHSHLTHPSYLSHPPNEISSHSSSHAAANFPAAKVQVTKVPNGLLIKWTFSSEHLSWQTFVERYELYAFVCNRGTDIPPVSQWGKVGEIKPLALPMAVTLTNFASGQCYAFSVRVHYVGGANRFSEPCTIEL